MLYPGKKVTTIINGGDVWMLESLSNNWWHCTNKDRTKIVPIHQDLLTPIFKIGDTVEAILPHKPELNGTYTLVAEHRFDPNYTWNLKDTQVGYRHFIHEMFLWPITPVEPNSCTCNITDLMRYGCKCGQFERERK